MCAAVDADVLWKCSRLETWNFGNLEKRKGGTQSPGEGAFTGEGDKRYTERKKKIALGFREGNSRMSKGGVTIAG